MRLETCYFCSRPAYPSKGITFCRNDGKQFRFCKSKCHNAFKHKRNPRKVGWTKAYRRAAGKEMTVDTTLQFAARRNVPVRYNRDLMQKTLHAMERVSEIRNRRERAFYRKRMAGKRAQELQSARKLVAEHKHLLPRLRGSEKRALAEQGATAEEVAAADREKALAPRKKVGKVFGAEKVRQRVTVDGDIVEEVDGPSGMTFDEEDDEEDLDGVEDEDEDEDDDMDMD